MPRRVCISTCIECPCSCHRKGERNPFCNALNRFIEVDSSMEVEKDCPLEEVDFQANSKENHRAAIKQIYQILQKKGMNEDSMHDANCYFNQYLKDLKNQ